MLNRGMMNNKGQVTAFVIIAVIIVAIIFILMMINRGNVSLREQDFDNPEAYLSTCIRQESVKILSDMFSHAGFINSEDVVLFNTEKITYLCKNINNFEPCVNQYPLYVTQLEKEFNKNIQDIANECLSSLKQELEDRNYDVVGGDNVVIDAKLKPEVIEIIFNTEMTISKGDVSRKFSRFNTFIPSKLQSIGFVVNEIVAQEAKWCYFNNDGFMILYPEYDIRVYMMEDTTKIYTIKDKKTGETLKMATRGCAIPAGWY